MERRTAWIIGGLSLLLVVLVALIFLALRDGDEEASETTLAPETTTTDAPVTTPESTTTTEPPTTTEATTTTEAPPTTLAGNWASEPLITTTFGALGYWDGATWVGIANLGDMPVTGGEDYQAVLLGVSAVLSGGPPTAVCEPLDNPGVELSNEAILGEFPGPIGVAISAGWDLTPHFVETADTNNPTYQGFASSLLASRGLDVATPTLKQLILFDLDGDGVNEILVVAEDTGDNVIVDEVGEYSIAFMRKVVQGEAQTAILGDSVITAEPIPYVGAFTVAAVADLSGDAKMEIVLNAAFFEGFSTDIWEYVNDDLGPVKQLETSCGS